MEEEGEGQTDLLQVYLELRTFIFKKILTGEIEFFH